MIIQSPRSSALDIRVRGRAKTGSGRNRIRFAHIFDSVGISHSRRGNPVTLNAGAVLQTRCYRHEQVLRLVRKAGKADIEVASFRHRRLIIFDFALWCYHAGTPRAKTSTTGRHPRLTPYTSSSDLVPHGLGEAEEKLNDKAAAKQSYAKYLEMEPNGKDARAAKKKLGRKD